MSSSKVARSVRRAPTKGCLLAVWFGALLAAAPSAAQIACEDPSFPQAIYRGTNDQLFFLADVNGDGRDDLMTIETEPTDFLTIRLADEAGLMGPRRDHAIGPWANRVRVADLDGDGLADIVVSKGALELVEILFNLGGGAFADPVAFDTGGGPIGLTLSDVDGDGHADLICCGPTADETGEVRVFHADGAGGLSLAAVREVGRRPIHIEAADLDGDGDRDLVTLDRDDGTISVLVNGGDGLFESRRLVFAGASDPSDLVLADANGDGTIDALLGDRNVLARSLTLFPGIGDGTFAPALRIPTTTVPIDIDAGDITGDGVVDILAAGERTSPAHLLVGRGEGIFFPPRPLQTPDEVLIELADVNGDGVLDLAFGEEEVNIVLGDARGLVFPSRLAVDGKANSVLAVDIDMDGDADIIAGVESRAEAVLAVFLNDGGGGFAERFVYPSTFSSNAVVAADFNGDGLLDLASAGGNVAVLIATAPGHYRDAQFLDVPSSASDIAAGDMNGDGRADLVVSREFGFDSITIFIGRGDGTFVSFAPQLLSDRPRQVAVGDVDGDGHLDVAATVHSVWLTLCRGNGEGTLEPPERLRLGTRNELFGLALHDMDADGSLDIITTLLGSGEEDVVIAWNDGSGGFPSTSVLPGAGYSTEVKIGDLNRDGVPDIVLSGVGYLLGLGDRSFGQVRRHNPGDRPMGVDVADFDGDGRDDLAVSNQEGRAVAVLVNPEWCVACAADLDGDGRLTVLDFLEFQTLFDAGDAKADFDGDGRLTLFDFLEFQSQFERGC